MFLIQENSNHPINDIVSSPPDESASRTKIERLLQTGELSQLVNENLPDILLRDNSASLSSESINEETTSLTWRIAKSDVANFVIKILKGSPHNANEPHFLTPNDMFIFFMAMEYVKPLFMNLKPSKTTTTSRHKEKFRNARKSPSETDTALCFTLVTLECKY